MIDNKSLVHIDVGGDYRIGLGKLLTYEFDATVGSGQIKITVEPFGICFVPDELSQLILKLGNLVTLSIIKGPSDEHRTLNLRGVDASTTERNGSYICTNLTLLFSEL
ncbi:hypothetical protein FNZ16_08875 [Salmonella enterica]|nr:hypothetical protein [Salmonella enterica]